MCQHALVDLMGDVWETWSGIPAKEGNDEIRVVILKVTDDYFVVEKYYKQETGQKAR